MQTETDGQGKLFALSTILQVAGDIKIPKTINTIIALVRAMQHTFLPSFVS